MFRDNAIALDELLAEREQAAAQLEKVVEERTAELHRRGTELRVTLENMAHAVVMFDSHRQLTAWKSPVSTLLELPEFEANRPLPNSYVTSPSGRVWRRRCRIRGAAIDGLIEIRPSSNGRALTESLRTVTIRCRAAER